MKKLLPLIAAVMLTAFLIAGFTATASAAGRESALDLSGETSPKDNMTDEGWSWDPETLTLTLSGFSGNGIKLPEGATVTVSGTNDAGAAGIEAPSLTVLGRGKLSCGSLKIAGELKLEGVPVTCGAPCEIGSLTTSYGSSVKIRQTPAPDAWFVSDPAAVVPGSEGPTLVSSGEGVSVYALNASAQHGKITFSLSGTRVAVTAEPDAGYAFSLWKSDEVKFSSKDSASTSFAAPTSNASVTAEFAQLKVPVKFTAGEGGKILNSDGEHLPGEKVALSAVPDTGWKFTGWTASSGAFDSAGSASAQFTVPEGGAEISASFEKEKYILTVITSDPSAGKTSITSGSYCYLDKLTLIATVTPGTDWVFSGWTAPAGVFSDPHLAATQFTMPAANVTVTATFTDKSDTNHITVFVSSGGKVLLDGGTELTGVFTQERLTGSRIKLTAVPDEGCTFAGWLQSAVTYKIAGAPGETVPFKVSEDGMTLEYVMTERSVSFSASFIASSRTLEVVSSGNGSASFSDPDPSVGAVVGNSVSVGKTLRIEASPDPGFIFAGWEVEGLPNNTESGKVIAQPNSAVTTLVMPNAMIKVTAHLLPEGADLTSSAPESSAAPASTVPDPTPAPSSAAIGSSDVPVPTESAPENENKEGISWPLLVGAALLAALGVALVIRAEKRRREGKVSLYRELFAKYNMKNLQKTEVKKLKERSRKTKNDSSGGKDE
ncbi:MAG: hypothetical protein IJV00_05520 [Clostridia bacterium]|nr:hypothetical protein [Clostridia bacterium]